MNLRFQLDRAYKKKVIESLEKSVRACALTVDARLAQLTPVDTGRARSNWLPSLNSPDVRIVEPGQKPDAGPILNSYNIGDTIYMTNNVPYIQRLNDGWSKQSPAGFVEDAIEAGKRAVKP